MSPDSTSGTKAEHMAGKLGLFLCEHRCADQNSDDLVQQDARLMALERRWLSVTKGRLFCSLQYNGYKTKFKRGKGKAISTGKALRTTQQ